MKNRIPEQAMQAMTTRREPHAKVSEAVAEDHRSVAARRKRDAMRTRILQTVMDVFSDRKNLSTTIEDVIKAADVSRGTFYKHFSSLEEALTAVGREATDQMTVGILPVYDVLEDPVQRVSTGMRLFLSRAVTDRRWARFVVRAELIPHESVLLDYIYRDVRAGRAEAKMDFDDVTAAADSIMGATVEGMRTILLGRTRDTAAYIDAVIRITLRGLGVDKRRAESATAFSLAHLAAHSANV
jgi:AcrR family transcriptional regulator